MSTYLHDKFLSIILKYIKLIKPVSILIALSGGKDSLCLIKLIEDFNNTYHHFNKIEYIYIDHQWRSDSKNNIKHLLNYLGLSNHYLYIYQIHTIDISESKIRQIRYQIMLRHAIQNKQEIILTGHNQTDQVETFLLNLIRGTGPEGLNSLLSERKVKDKVQLIRPLIHIKTGEILWFCRKFNLPIWSDKTNYFYINSRNRVRNELLPYLKQYFNPRIEYSIINFLNICSIENEYIKQNSIKLYLTSRHSYYIALNWSIIANQHLALQKRVLHIFFYHNFNKYLNNYILEKLLKITYLKKIVIIWENLKINIYKNWIYIQ
uniref:tRNA(Ile)-lysidine synthase, chloroplastic n=1 Tax=Gracilaria vermiculophylla TaxID=2608709 RepID=A0A345U8T6_9FLOR|nr:tRNAIle-lysidine synthetase [Gracilaria vermiculophylla]AXI96872.1 tRNAIle-lysidine synthetase [Gracilaria vermiculophylla]WDZ67920.1 tRNAIle-lysidine synthetase [Gracilaria vermiculophylla]